MASKNRKIIKLNSTGTKEDGQTLTGFYYTTFKSTKYPEKIKKRKFDPFAFNSVTGKRGMHVLFEEGKIK